MINISYVVLYLHMLMVTQRIVNSTSDSWFETPPSKTYKWYEFTHMAQTIFFCHICEQTIQNSREMPKNWAWIKIHATWHVFFGLRLVDTRFLQPILNFSWQCLRGHGMPWLPTFTPPPPLQSSKVFSFRSVEVHVPPGHRNRAVP